MFDKETFSKIINKIKNTYETQEEFSKKSGINRTYISYYSNCKLDDPPKPNILKRLSNASNGITTYSELMFVCGYTNSYVDNLTPNYICAVYEFSNDNDKRILSYCVNYAIQNRVYNIYDDAIIQGELKKLKNLDENLVKSIIQKLSTQYKNLESFSFEDYSISNHYSSLDNSVVRSNVFPIADTPEKVPVVGKISAGLPILATENIEGYEFAPSSYIKEGYNYFYLRVQGDSMNQKFNDGDIVLVQEQPTLENDEIGVILIDGMDATVKKYRETNGMIILEPMSTNSENHTQIYNPKDVPIRIVGKVVSYQGRI